MATTQSTHLAEVNIWNEEPIFRMWKEIAEDTLEIHDNDERQAQYDLAGQMKNYYLDQNPIDEYVNVFADLMGWAIQCVDWYEIAEDFIEHVKDIR